MERRGSSKRTLILYKYLSAKKSRQERCICDISKHSNIQHNRYIFYRDTKVPPQPIHQTMPGRFYYTFQNISFEDDYLNFGQTEYCLNIFTIFDDIIFRDERLLPMLTSFCNQGTLVIIKSYINFDYSGEDLKR